MTDFHDLTEQGRLVAAQLRRRGETLAVAESAAGGLISAALLAVDGASAFYRGGAVIYTGAARAAFLDGTVPVPDGMRGATEGFARYEAEAVAQRLGTTWGIGETGAAGPTGNPYGDPAGHAWVAVHGLVCSSRHVLTDSDDRVANMMAFAHAALEELVATLARAA